MEDLSITSRPEPQEWDQIISASSKPEVNQTWEWGEVMRSIKGIKPIRLLVKQGDKPVGALQAFEWKIGPVSMTILSGESGGGGGPVVLDTLPADFRLIVAKKLLDELIAEFKKRRSLKLTIYASPDFGSALPPLPPTKHTTKWTPIIPLISDEHKMLNEVVEQKARNQINKSNKNGVSVIEGSRNDLEVYQSIQSDLVKRKSLSKQHLNSVRSLQTVWDTLTKKNMIKLFLAKHEGHTVGGVLILYSGKGLLYRSGVLTEEGRNLYAGNALQWAVISDAIKGGYSLYNMSGGTDDPNDERFGITKFKLSFGGELKPFVRYSAHGNRLLRFIIFRARRLIGKNEWLPLAIYP
ncbi:peptidoglycan bridge formation glycyltransferase FemA/FemB family protein [Patescibacteria group bacterium]|nr:peptidoglycan bridge formation glycyltransferase FemA/FemB family protein [Patescibacteria group bacterium]